MSNLSDFRGSPYKIGDVILAEERGESFTRGSEIWLRTGVIDSASTYPQAASLEHMRVIGLAAVLPSSMTVTDVAHNSAGIWIAAFGDATNIARSVDDGVTWNLVAHNAAGAVFSVARGAGVFVAMGNSAAAFQPSSSSDGSAWTVRTGTAITTATGNTCWVRFGGGQFVACCGGVSATGQISTSPDGINWTARNGSQAISNLAKIAYNGTIWLVLGSTSAAMSSTDAITWTNRTAPASANPMMAANTTLFLCVFGISPTSYYTTTDAITFTQRFMPVNAANASPRGFRVGPAVTYTGTYFLITSVPDTAGLSNAMFYYSADGISGWKRRWLSASHTVNTNAQWLVAGYGTKLVCLPSGNSTGSVAASASALYHTNFPAGADFIGSSFAAYPGSAGGSLSVLYLRVR